MSFVCTTVIAHIFNTCSYLFNFYCVSLKLVYPYKQIYKIISIEWETFIDYSFEILDFDFESAIKKYI